MDARDIGIVELLKDCSERQKESAFVSDSNNMTENASSLGVNNPGTGISTSQGCVCRLSVLVINSGSRVELGAY